jgi:hypothetical protein
MEHAAGRSAASGRAEKEALDALEFDWGDAYMIGRDDERGWWAARRDRIGGYFTAPGPDELREAIRADYALEPVPRSVSPADRS